MREAILSDKFFVSTRMRACIANFRKFVKKSKNVGLGSRSPLAMLGLHYLSRFRLLVFSYACS